MQKRTKEKIKHQENDDGILDRLRKYVLRSRGDQNKHLRMYLFALKSRQHCVSKLH